MQPEALAPAHDPRIGLSVADRYRIVRLLGEGGMGTVYEAEQLGVAKRVAIKTLHPQLARDRETCTRFQREAEAATAIGHPNIVEVNDTGNMPDGSPFMVLELLEGRDFGRDLRDNGPQRLGKVIHILCQACDALGVAHALGILHRDMKPENVFLTERGGDPNFVKVLDFGISKMFDRNAESALTETGTTVGTPQYMAPEQCRGRKDLDGRADIYALGVILFRALTGAYPFVDDSYPMLVVKICTEPAPRLSEYRTDLPPSLQDVLDRMLAKKREDRYRTCAELRVALEPFLHHRDAPVLVEHPPDYRVRTPQVLGARDTEPASPILIPSPKPSGGLRAALLIGGAALTLLVSVAFVVGLGVAHLSSRTPDPVEPIATQVTVPPPVEDDAPAVEAVTAETAVPVAPSEPTEPSSPPQVRVRFSATPSSARMFLDDNPIGNPIEMDVPRDPDPVDDEPRRYHLLRVQAPGYRTHEQELAFRYDNMTYPVELQRGRADNIVRVAAEPTQPVAPRSIVAPRPVVQAVSPERRAIFPQGSPRPASNPSQTVGRGAIFGGR